MFCQATGTSLESPDLSYLWGPATHVDRVCLKFHCFVIQWFSLLKRLNFIALSSLYPITGHVFTLITPPPLIISVVQSAACVQVYSTLYPSVLHRCLQLHSALWEPRRTSPATSLVRFASNFKGFRDLPQG